ncbi:MAG: V-type ATP synthase subunit D [Lentisphaeria bacterium]
MSRLNISPTKSNHIKIRHDLDMATEGFNLLDQKREILVMELMRLLDRVRRAEKKLEEKRENAYNVLRTALAKNGYNQMERVGSGINYEHKVEVSQRVVAGVKIPEIEVTPGQFSLQFGFAGTDSLVDETMAAFLELLKVIGEMAHLQSSVWLLSRELKKTQRRVNALEQIFIPDFKDTLQHIEEILEGKELEEFSMRKLVKEKKQR